MLIQNYTINGQPARVWPFSPNWSSPVNEVLEWKTDILRSFNGAEQRRALRIVPRRSFEYGMWVKNEFSSMLEAYLWGWQHKYFGLPVWTDMGKLTSDVSIGQMALPVITSNLGFRNHDSAILYADPKNYEVVEIDVVSPTNVTIKSPIAGGWPAGTKVYPLILSHLGTSVQTSRRTSRVIEIGNIIFDTSGDTAYDHLPSGVAQTIYDGYEVVTHRPNWKDAISNEFSRLFDTVDSGVGPIAYYPHEATSRIVRPVSWLLKNRSEIMDFRRLLGRLRGQAKTVWLPSWHDDFEIAGTNHNMEHVLVVKGIWFKAFVDLDPSRDRLMVTLPNGNVVYRRIISVNPNYNEDTTQLQLDSSLGTTVTVNDNTRVRLLMRCRLATDKVVIPWRTTEVADPQTNFTTVKL